MTNKITLWTKPACVQCDAIKRRLVQGITGLVGLPKNEMLEEFQRLVNKGIVYERDLTTSENEESLKRFKTLGYTSAPITEFGSHAVPGYIPAEIDNIIEKAGVAA